MFNSKKHIKGTKISLIIGVLLFIILTCIYWKGFSIKIPLILMDKEYITLLFGLIGLTFGIFKFFYVIELKDKHSEVNRIKSYYYTELNHEPFGGIINLSDDELLDKYNEEALIKKLEESKKELSKNIIETSDTDLEAI